MLPGYDLLQLVLELVHVLHFGAVGRRRRRLLHPLLPRSGLELLPDLLVVALPAIRSCLWTQIINECSIGRMTN